MGNITPAQLGRAKKGGGFMASLDEQIKKQEQKLVQAKARLARLQHQKKEIERRDRTHRLVQRGALAEKYLRCSPDMAMEDFEKLLARIVTIPQVQSLLPGAGQGEPAPAEKM